MPKVSQWKPLSQPSNYQQLRNFHLSRCWALLWSHSLCLSPPQDGWVNREVLFENLLAQLQLDLETADAVAAFWEYVLFPSPVPVSFWWAGCPPLAWVKGSIKPSSTRSTSKHFGRYQSMGKGAGGTFISAEESYLIVQFAMRKGESGRNRKETVSWEVRVGPALYVKPSWFLHVTFCHPMGPERLQREKDANLMSALCPPVSDSLPEPLVSSWERRQERSVFQVPVMQDSSNKPCISHCYWSHKMF